MKKTLTYFLLFWFVILILKCSDSKEDVNLKYNEAIKFYSEKKLEKAISSFENVLESDKSFLPAKIMLGKSYYYNGDYQKSLEIFQSIEKEYSGNSLAMNWLGKILIQYPEKTEESKEYFLKSIQLDDNQIDSYYYLGRISENKGDIKSALLYYNQGIEISKKSEKIKKSILNIYNKAGINTNEK